MKPARLSVGDKNRRMKAMSELRDWLKAQKKTQAWLGKKLGIYPGYVNNLLRLRQIPSESIVEKSRKLMGRQRVVTNIKAARAALPIDKSRDVVKQTKRRITEASSKPVASVVGHIGPRYLCSEAIQSISLIADSYLKTHRGLSVEQVGELLRGLRRSLVVV